MMKSCYSEVASFSHVRHVCFLGMLQHFLRTFSDFDFPYVRMANFGNWSDNGN